MFTCVASNAAGSARQDIRLSVNMRPAFKELPGDVTLNKGLSLALSCHAQGTPSPVISWTVNSSPYTGILFLCTVTTYILPKYHSAIVGEKKSLPVGIFCEIAFNRVSSHAE